MHLWDKWKRFYSLLLDTWQDDFGCNGLFHCSELIIAHLRAFYWKIGAEWYLHWNVTDTLQFYAWFRWKSAILRLMCNNNRCSVSLDCRYHSTRECCQGKFTKANIKTATRYQMESYCYAVQTGQCRGNSLDAPSLQDCCIFPFLFRSCLEQSASFHNVTLHFSLAWINL